MSMNVEVIWQVFNSVIVFCILYRGDVGAQDARLKMFSKWQFPEKDPPVATHCFTCMEEKSAVLVKDLVNTADLCQSVLHLHS